MATSASRTASDNLAVPGFLTACSPWAISGVCNRGVGICPARRRGLGSFPPGCVCCVVNLHAGVWSWSNAVPARVGLGTGGGDAVVGGDRRGTGRGGTVPWPRRRTPLSGGDASLRAAPAHQRARRRHGRAPRARGLTARLTKRVSAPSVRRQRRLIDLRSHRHPP